VRFLLVLFCCAISVHACARSGIVIVGSSTVYPFATIIAEQFGRSTKYRIPTVESTGTGSGLSLFCKGIGTSTPDISNASRPIKASERELCKANGVSDIIELKLGYDGIVIANASAAPLFEFAKEDLYLALAKMVPSPTDGAVLIENPYRYWNEVNPMLPNTKIEIMGPPPSSGTREAFLKLAVEPGCQSQALLRDIKESDPQQYKALCHNFRTDGAYIEAGENDNLIVQKILANPSSLGIFGYNFLTANKTAIKASSVVGVKPTLETISSGEYRISRSLFMYVKKIHIGVVPGLMELLLEYRDLSTGQQESYLAKRGLIPLSHDDYQATKLLIDELNSQYLKQAESHVF